MNLFKRLFLSILIFVVLSGCEKENPIPSRVDLLTQASWRLEEFTSTPTYPISINGQIRYFSSIMDFYKSYRPCHTDQTLSFNVGSQDYQYQHGNYQYKDGNSSCNTQAEIINKTGEWYFDELNQVIYLYLIKSKNPTVIDELYKVYELSFNRLIISYKVQIAGASQIYEFKKTYVRTN